MNANQKISVSIVTGFLGSGKTTLLNCLLSKPELKSTAVIINEFGEIGIDHLLVETSSEQMVEMNNGCICCTIRGDLSDKLQSLAMWLDAGRIPPVERVIVETTGLADPAPIMHTLMTDEDLLRRYRLGRVTTVVDATLGPSSLERFPEAVKQIAIADSLIISKSDLLAPSSGHKAPENFKERLRKLNPRAEIFESDRGKVEISAVIPSAFAKGQGAFHELSKWLNVAENTHSNGRPTSSDAGHAHGDIRTFLVEKDEPLDCESFGEFLQKLVIDYGENILRVKGIVSTLQKPSQPAVIQGVQHVFFPITWLDSWKNQPQCSRLVFITRGIDPEIIVSRFKAYFESTAAVH